MFVTAFCAAAAWRFLLGVETRLVAGRRPVASALWSVMVGTVSVLALRQMCSPDACGWALAGFVLGGGIGTGSAAWVGKREDSP